jgi:hypothetical protein
MHIGIACPQFALDLRNLPAAVIDVTLQLAGAQR